MLDGVRLDESSPAAVAVTSWHDQLYLAWTGTDMHVNVASSPDGRAITGKQQTAHRSCTPAGGGPGGPSYRAFAPALAVSGERLYLAWMDSDFALNLVAAEHAADGVPQTLKEPAVFSPSLMTGGDGNLMLAWLGGRGPHVNLVTLAPDSSGVLVPVEGTQTQFEKAKSYNAPALCSHQGSLVLAWTGTDRHVNILTGAEEPYGAPTQLEQVKSGSAPALCSHQGSLIIAWSGSDHHLNVARLR